MNEDVGGDDLVLAETGEANGVNRTAEATANPIPVGVEGSPQYAFTRSSVAAGAPLPQPSNEGFQPVHPW